MDSKYLIIIILTLAFVLFLIPSLYFCFKEDEPYRKGFKLPPIFTLVVLVFVILFNQPLAYLALTFGMIGDTFLLSMNKKLFSIGVYFFLLEHILNLTLIISLTNNSFPLYLLTIYPLLVLFLFSTSFIKFKNKISKPFLALGAIYGSMLLLNLFVGFHLFVVTKNLLLLPLVFGYVLFIISDSVILYKRFFGRFKKIQFLIMSTYYLAQYLIFISFIFMVI